MYYIYNYEAGKGLVYVGKQDTRPAAEEALKEQQGEDIFKNYTLPDIQKIQMRLDEIRSELGQLMDELYASSSRTYKPSDSYKTPEKRRAEIRQRMAELEVEETSLQAALQMLVEATPEGKPDGEAFSGSAEKVIAEREE